MTSHISRRGFIGSAAGAAALSAAGLRPAYAAFPERGILVVVPYAAGGGSDISARLLARDFELPAFVLDFVEQPRVLNRQHRLRGKGLDQVNGVLRECPWRAATHHQHSDDLLTP